MSKPVQDTCVLDIDFADRIAWAYKKGLLAHADALRKMVDECGLSGAIALCALAEGPQYYSDENPPGSAGEAEQIIIEALDDGSIKITEKKLR
jgi:hypothetical protein